MLGTISILIIPALINSTSAFIFHAESTIPVRGIESALKQSRRRENACSSGVNWRKISAGKNSVQTFAWYACLTRLNIDIC